MCDQISVDKLHVSACEKRGINLVITKYSLKVVKCTSFTSARRVSSHFRA